MRRNREARPRSLASPRPRPANHDQGSSESSFSGDVPSLPDPDDWVVFFLTVFRREIARALLREFADQLSVDAGRTRRPRSRAQRLRNGVGALLRVSSDLAWRPTSLVSLSYLLRAGTQSRLRFGISELGSAVAPPASLQRHRALVVGAPIMVALAATAVYARRLRAEHDAQSASWSAEEAPVAARV